MVKQQNDLRWRGYLFWIWNVLSLLLNFELVVTKNGSWYVSYCTSSSLALINFLFVSPCAKNVIGLTNSEPNSIFFAASKPTHCSEPAAVNQFWNNTNNKVLRRKFNSPNFFPKPCSFHLLKVQTCSCACPLSFAYRRWACVWSSQIYLVDFNIEFMRLLDLR